MAIIPELNKLVKQGTSLAFKKNFNMFSALALIRRNDVSSTFKKMKLMKHFDDNAAVWNEFFDYFEKTWLGEVQDSRRGTRANKILWNQYASLNEGVMKTTSSLELWHNKFKNMVNRKAPTFEWFYDCLLTEQSSTENLMISIRNNLETTYTTKRKTNIFNNINTLSKESYDASTVLENLEKLAVALMNSDL